MKKRYELQVLNEFSNRWGCSNADHKHKTLKEKINACIEAMSVFYPMGEWRVVQKLGRKVIKVIYPEGGSNE